MNRPTATLPADRIEGRILVARGHRVMLDRDLAALYGVTTARLNQQMTRNLRRFPQDFAFRLTRAETENLMLQFATSSSAWGGRRKRPYVFTEHGAVMLASVLNSAVAVRASIQVVRAFIQFRQWMATHAGLARKLDDLEMRCGARHRAVVNAVRRLMESDKERPKGRIGFHRQT